MSYELEYEVRRFHVMPHMFHSGTRRGVPNDRKCSHKGGIVTPHILVANYFISYLKCNYKVGMNVLQKSRP